MVLICHSKRDFDFQHGYTPSLMVKTLWVYSQDDVTEHEATVLFTDTVPPPSVLDKAYHSLTRTASALWMVYHPGIPHLIATIFDVISRNNPQE